MSYFRRVTLATLAAPLALGLAACSEETVDLAALEGEPVASVPAPDGTEWAQVTQVTDMQGHLIGNPDAPIKLVEYGSLTCGTCAAFTQNGVEELKSEYINSGRVSFELRPMVLNGIDLVLVRLARCGTDEAVVPLSDQWWTGFQENMAAAQQNQEALGAAMDNEDQSTRYVQIAEAAGFFDWFAARGVSRDQARACLADGASVQAIADRSSKQAKELGVTGTPTFFLNDQKLINVLNWEQLEPILQRAGARES